MCGNIVCLAAVLLGVDARWPSLPDGGLQYVIQIEPYALDRRESGASKAIRSHVPPYVRDIRAYQIVMGTPRSAKNVPTANVHSPILTGVDTDWVPVSSGGAECRVWIKPEALDELAKPGRAIEGKIPPNVKRPIVFTVSVGTKPRVAVSRATIEADPPPEPLITPSLPPERSVSRPPLPLPSMVPRPIDSPDMSEVQMTLKEARSPSPPWVAPTDSPSAPPVFKPIAGSAQPAIHLEQSQATLDDLPQTKADSNLTTKKEEESAEGSATPRLLHDVTLIGLFASFGGNVFLLWFVWNFRSRYLSLLRRLGEAGDIVNGCVSDLEESS